MDSVSDAWSPLIAGFTGGVVSTSLLLPLDVIKVRLQVQESKLDSRKRSIGAVHVMRTIVRHEGMRGLWVGWSPAVIGSAVSWGGYFYFYEAMKGQLLNQRLSANKSRDKEQGLTSIDNFVLACSAGGIMVLITNPIWLIKTRMQLQLKKSSELHNIRPYRSILDAASRIVRGEGPLALYKGTGPALLLTSHGGVQFVVYEYLKKHFHFRRAKRASNGLDSTALWDRLEKSAGYLTMGAISKIIASTTTYPLQTVKARMQQRSDALEFTAEGEVRVVKREYGGLVTTVKSMFLKEGGIRPFFSGALPNALRVAPGAAITFLVYEAVMDYLG